MRTKTEMIEKYNLLNCKCCATCVNGDDTLPRLNDYTVVCRLTYKTMWLQECCKNYTSEAYIKFLKDKK